MRNHEMDKEALKELTQEEVNVYAGCGEPRGCLLDCYDFSPLLTTAK